MMLGIRTVVARAKERANTLFAPLSADEQSVGIRRQLEAAQTELTSSPWGAHFSARYREFAHLGVLLSRNDPKRDPEGTRRLHDVLAEAVEHALTSQDTSTTGAALRLLLDHSQSVIPSAPIKTIL
jgi:hypothetical protein